MVNGLDVVLFYPGFVMLVWSCYAITLLSLRDTLQ